MAFIMFNTKYLVFTASQIRGFDALFCLYMIENIHVLASGLLMGQIMLSEGVHRVLASYYDVFLPF